LRAARLDATAALAAAAAAASGSGSGSGPAGASATPARGYGIGDSNGYPSRGNSPEPGPPGTPPASSVAYSRFMGDGREEHDESSSPREDRESASPSFRLGVAAAREAAEREAAALRREAQEWPGKSILPRHMLPFNSSDDGLQRGRKRGL